MPAVPFPDVIDSTFIAALDACEEKAYRAYIEHWKPRGESIHLVAGAAYAAGLEETRRAFWERNESPANALASGASALIQAYGDFQPSDRDTKTLDRMLGALEFYFSECPLGTNHVNHDGEPLFLPGTQTRAIEFSFAEPLPIAHPTTGDPLIYSGRADMLVSWADGAYVWDDKTTSSLGPSWSSQWDLRSQFTGYCWAAQNHNITVKGVITNGVSILKTKYDRARVLTYRTDWEISRWLDMTCKKLARFIEAWCNDSRILNLNESCTSYGGCTFRDVCKSPDPLTWLRADFARREWNPLTRTETSLPPL